MIQLFQYNAEVRNEWFDLCKHISKEELTRTRIGGVGSILYTLFHVADVEYSWVRGIQGKPDIVVNYEEYKSLEQVRHLSSSWNQETLEFLHTWTEDRDTFVTQVSWHKDIYTEGEILRHVIAHEIHHMGQLSIWTRELEIKPVSANFIGRSLR
ncbi:putative damage-inducible protein DinB [Paenibacillus shirakamiensis]|uniref:Damage-inducible protein DinB n=1 Tax=Paenibacillus shirakamiensis TaxID=1265935 RepID=A0ABS4JFY6_9BACL|nr:DinB family protein [Paenibacillus shirakamiensis]MBP2000617.1 putative damage-inducible protein DinB [Paenibacillus shirakamiensis]